MPWIFRAKKKLPRNREELSFVLVGDYGFEPQTLSV